MLIIKLRDLVGLLLRDAFLFLRVVFEELVAEVPGGEGGPFRLAWFKRSEHDLHRRHLVCGSEEATEVVGKAFVTDQFRHFRHHMLEGVLVANLRKVEKNFVEHFVVLDVDLRVDDIFPHLCGHFHVHRPV